MGNMTQMQRERVYDVLREALELLLHEPQQVLSIHCLSRWYGSKMIQNGSRNDMIVDCLNFNADCRSCSAFSGRSFWYLSLDSFDRRHSTLTAPTNEYFAYVAKLSDELRYTVPVCSNQSEQRHCYYQFAAQSTAEWWMCVSTFRTL